MLIRVHRSSWGLASCAISVTDDDAVLRVEPGDLDRQELDACLRSEWAGHVLDEGTVLIREEWLRRELHRSEARSPDEFVEATIVRSAIDGNGIGRGRGLRGGAANGRGARGQ